MFDFGSNSEQKMNADQTSKFPAKLNQENQYIMV